VVRMAEPLQSVSQADVPGQPRVSIAQRPHGDVRGGPRAHAANLEQRGRIATDVQAEPAVEHQPSQRAQRFAPSARKGKAGRVGGGQRGGGWKVAREAVGAGQRLSQLLGHAPQHRAGARDGDLLAHDGSHRQLEAVHG